MNLPSLITALLVAAVIVSIVVVQIRNRKAGKSSCSCGGSCGSCGMNCSCGSQK